jgi:hypothetical protein
LYDFRSTDRLADGYNSVDRLSKATFKSICTAAASPHRGMDRIFLQPWVKRWHA